MSPSYLGGAISELYMLATVLCQSTISLLDLDDADVPAYTKPIAKPAITLPTMNIGIFTAAVCKIAPSKASVDAGCP